MKLCIEERVLKAANYFITNKSTIRKTAKALDVSKTTIEKDLKVRLPFIDKDLAKEVNSVLEINKAECHIRDGTVSGAHKRAPACNKI